MNAIEQAQLRTRTREERKARYAQQAAEAPPAVVVPQVVPKEKDDAGVIEILVTIPGGEFTFKFVKPNIRSNVPAGRISKEEFRRAFISGLAPLLGNIIER